MIVHLYVSVCVCVCVTCSQAFSIFCCSSTLCIIMDRPTEERKWERAEKKSVMYSFFLPMQLVFVSGHFKMSDSDPFLVSIVRPVSPPSILEIRMEGNMYVTHYSLDFRCTFYDGR